MMSSSPSYEFSSNTEITLSTLFPPDQLRTSGVVHMSVQQGNDIPRELIKFQLSITHGTPLMLLQQMQYQYEYVLQHHAPSSSMGVNSGHLHHQKQQHFPGMNCHSSPETNSTNMDMSD